MSAWPGNLSFPRSSTPLAVLHGPCNDATLLVLMVTKGGAMATWGKPTRKKTSTTRKAIAAGTVHSAAALRAIGKRRHDLQQSIAADRKQRADDYCKRVKPLPRTRALALAPPSFHILAEGDSWFDYPSPSGRGADDRHLALSASLLANVAASDPTRSAERGEEVEVIRLSESLAAQERVSQAILQLWGSREFARLGRFRHGTTPHGNERGVK